MTEMPMLCPHGKAWATCCLEEVLTMNPHLNREEIVFTKKLGWVYV